MSEAVVELGDCLEVLKGMESDSIDALVCDPPAGIGFMSAKWDSNKGSRNNWIAWLTEIMEEALRVCKPGAHGFVWALPRTSHWTAMALEDAGWEIRDRVAHHFGQGFPKSANVGKLIDKLAGAEEAKQWEGWGSALKPATEDYWLVRKPLSESSIARNVLKHGTGAINIDESRVAHRTVANGNLAENTHLRDDVRRGKGSIFGTSETEMRYTRVSGRFPANVLLSHSPQCEKVGVRRVRGSGSIKGDEQSKPAEHVHKSGFKRVPMQAYADPDGYEEVEDFRCVEGCPVLEIGRQSDNAARFFQTFEPDTGAGIEEATDEELVGAIRYLEIPDEKKLDLLAFLGAAAEPHVAMGFQYVAKASRRERNAGLESVEEKPLLWSAGTKNPGSFQSKGTKKAAQNNHPTVKSLALMRYLVKMITPPGGTVLDPFCGSGSTGCAAALEGFDFIGIEQDAEYAEIARKRIAHWSLTKENGKSKQAVGSLF